MKSNLNFEITALGLSILLLLSYLPRNYLPLRRNRYFYMTISSHISLILINIAASITTAYYEVYPVWFLYLVNIVFFLMLTIEYYLFFNYTMSISRHSFFKSPVRQVLVSIPMLVMCGIVISTPFTHILFTLDSVNGYTRQWAYYYILVPYMYCYIIFSAVYLSYFHHDIVTSQMLAVLGSYALIVLGAFLQVSVFPGTLLINYFVAFGLLIIYMSMQNPEYYISGKASCFNYRAFIDFTTEYADSYHNFSILNFRVHHYQTLVNAYGDMTINSLLRQIAMMLKSNFKSSLDRVVIFYLDDGIFSIIKRGDMNTGAFMETISSRFERPWTTAVGDIQLDISFSYLPKELASDNSHNLLAVVRNSLNSAASMSKNQYDVIEADMFKAQTRDNDVHKAIQKALEYDSFEVYYQPIYDTKKKKIISAEALARLFDDKLGSIPPDEFIVKAEQDGSIIQLGQQIYVKTLRFMKNHKELFKELEYLEINLSPVQCTTPNLAEQFIDLAFDNRVDLSKVNLEITETATYDIAILKKQMKTLHNLGVRFSLDDYGTGFSNLTMILQLPLSTIKIDKSLVWAYFDGSNYMLRSIVKMFKDQNLKIICEGIETKEMVDTLTEIGVDYLQGYYFSKPIPEDQFIDYVKEFNERKN
ncbi:EAL domain-containing protein [Oribacterium sp. WCC10]|uniref:EAL domain-containing protein n=1 Tax=Oribacterium sp. WCC10 TaxID=1855343 RepID=UPI0008E58F9E|nr:GGDEF domain-containing phosphodiesterase [Oribacterium sp. WCC10]SFG09653.1 EAL domain, c-di-GMP-specific phosphodiesterase class I (or its enzymatically inactive variant) [Oribacterium sp. WCC10]